jgi:hypothetical protein
MGWSPNGPMRHSQSLCRPLLEDRARALSFRLGHGLPMSQARVVPCRGLYQQSLTRPSVVARRRPTSYRYDRSGAEETSEGAVEDISNQKSFKLAPKQYKIKRQVTLC